ncbi:hypothetical protein ES319_D04G208300v1 [Gossypium barbadense]|uniref:Uncharacterized protein n=3 Tax=Gossypium TaxID=3633 RepID=A0A5J5RYJ8_GOSBA|nr:hypothetical protein ES319_D04G208300v1 [Gossypium barbadense]TYG74874.1 hypothetical protein ES288_D04G218800v1 [Gossypium darwinii]
MVINDLDLCYCLRKLWRTVEFLRGGGGSVASKEKLRDDAGSSSRPLFRIIIVEMILNSIWIGGVERKTKGKTARRCRIFFSVSV